MRDSSLITPIPMLAASITKEASRQTYYTIRLLADRQRVDDAYRTYAYFRWVDDTIDGQTSTRPERRAFVERQKLLLESRYRRESPPLTCPEEEMLVDLVRANGEHKSGLDIYLSHMMVVMAFDAERRGRLISQFELNEYTHYLASAVTEAMHHFIGHDCFSPRDGTRYLAVSAAHITHMLRDTLDDIQAGYYNVPREALEKNCFSAEDVKSAAYRDWVKGRVQIAREYFRAGRCYLSRVQNLRCRLAGLVYTARFEGVLDAIERDEYVLRPSYPEGKGPGPITRACASILKGMMDRTRAEGVPSEACARQRSY